jgi:hypothetical protein
MDNVGEFTFHPPENLDGGSSLIMPLNGLSLSTHRQRSGTKR